MKAISLIMLLLLASCAKHKDTPPTMVDRAHYDDAVARIDASFCDKIVNSAMRQACQDDVNLKLASAQGDEGICGQLQNQTKKEECVDNQRLADAVQAKDKSKCNAIASSIVKARCLSTVAYTDAVINLNSDSCGQIADASEQAVCRNMVIQAKALKDKDASSCSSLPVYLQQGCRDDVYFSNAVSAKDPTLCTPIVNAGKKAECERTVIKLL